ncbi:MAG: terminase large subunit domain-containing protein [Bacilli bacterium]
MEKSRQIGMSWTAAYELVRRHALSGCKLDSWVSSRDEMQAKLFIDDCKKFASILNVACEDISGSGIIAASDSRTLEFANSTRIWSLSSNPDAQAGKRGTRVLDEFALHPDPARLYSVAYPGITWGGSLEIISTHRGSENFFHKLVEEARYNGNPKNISLHRVTLQDALEQGFLKKLKESLPEEHEVSSMDEGEYFDYIKNSCADTESFLQEYMCEPADDNAGFIPYDAVQKCVYKNGEDWKKIISSENPLYLGVDVGRSRDLTVFWLVELCGDVLYTRDVKVFCGVPFSEQEVALHSYLSLPSLRRAAIDQSGLGRQFAERAQQRYSSSRVEGVSFTSSAKECWHTLCVRVSRILQYASRRY